MDVEEWAGEFGTHARGVVASRASIDGFAHPDLTSLRNLSLIDSHTQAVERHSREYETTQSKYISCFYTRRAHAIYWTTVRAHTGEFATWPLLDTPPPSTIVPQCPEGRLRAHKKQHNPAPQLVRCDGARGGSK